MKYQEFQLSSPLSDHIQLMWGIESESDDDVYPRSLIMPDGIVEVIFHFAEPYYTWQNDEQFIQPTNFAISMMRKFVEIGSSGRTGFISVRFFPWGAYHFFNEPIRGFLDQTIDASGLWGNDSKVITGRLKQEKIMEQRFKLVEQFLLEKLKEFQKKEMEVENAIKLIRQTRGTLSIESVCAETGFSKKQLERKFLATAGTTPKLFSRITRFLNICQNLKEEKSQTLTQLTHDCGFYDQAHFIKEFKAFSGFTPKEFYEKENIFFSEI